MNTLSDSLTAFGGHRRLDRRRGCAVKIRPRMIASEELCTAGRDAGKGSVLTNKYARLPGRRYGGWVRRRSGEAVGYRPRQSSLAPNTRQRSVHSGATANAAAMHALLSPATPSWGCRWLIAVT